MGGGGDKFPFPDEIKIRYVKDILGLFHHYHHQGEITDADHTHLNLIHEVHHCEHTEFLSIVHCGCLTNNREMQHATNVDRLDSMLHLPDITGIARMELILQEKCPRKLDWFHIGSVDTIVEYIHFPKYSNLRHIQETAVVQ